jgi:hypothetical protein
MNRPPRCLILVRAGDNSVHEGWLEPASDKTFDLAVSYYARTPGRWAQRADYYSAQPGPKWPCVADWLDENWEWVSAYDFVAVPDDDMGASSTVWDGLFRAMQRHRLDLAAPAIAADSNWCHPITAQRPGSSCRITNFLENNLVSFSKRALRWCAPTLRMGSSGVGSDYAWPAIVRHNGGRVGIVDEVCVRHERPHHGAGASVYNSEDSLASVLPHAEMFDEMLLMAAFGIGNPYDPFVEQTIGAESAKDRRSVAPGSSGPTAAKQEWGERTTPHASHVVVGSGTPWQVLATLESVCRRRAAGDEVLLVDATFDSHLRSCLGDAYPAVTVIDAPDQGLSESYDLAIARSAHDLIVVVGAGWLLGSRFREQV